MKLGPLRVAEAHRYADFKGQVIDEFQSASPLTNGWGGQTLPDSAVEPPGAPDYRELGATGVTIYGGVFLEEYLPDLRGRQGTVLYDRMRRSDGQIKGLLRMLKVPLLAAEWYIQPGGTDKASKRNADFMTWAMFERPEHNFTDVLREILSMLEFGFYPFEKVFDLDVWSPGQSRVRKRGRAKSQRPVVVWKKLAPRSPRTVMRWFFDPQGGFQGFLQQRLTANAGFEYVILPANKLMMFTFEGEAGNPEGVSVLRACYKHWFIKDNLIKIDAIQKERHGIGIPEISLPPGFNTSDKQLANEMGRNLRSNEKAHVVKLPGWEINFLELKGQPVDIIKSIEYHDTQMSKSVLSSFLDMGTGASASRGSPQLATAAIDVFLKSMQHTGDTICDQFNAGIRELIDFNFSDGEYPELRVRNIGENSEFRTLSVAMRNLVESDVIRPDDILEAWIRDQLDLPERNKATDRVIEEREYSAELQQELKIEANPGAAGQDAPYPDEGLPNPVKQKTGQNTGDRVTMPTGD